jgi:hypothetical protein
MISKVYLKNSTTIYEYSLAKTKAAPVLIVIK